MKQQIAVFSLANSRILHPITKKRIIRYCTLIHAPDIANTGTCGATVFPSPSNDIFTMAKPPHHCAYLVRAIKFDQ
jgi:hypothetical protein